MTVQERNAEIVRMYVEDNLTLATIAERMGLPVGTVSGRISQARKRGDVPYRREASARHAFGRSTTIRGRVREGTHEVDSGGPNAATILKAVNGRVAELERELALLRDVQRALAGK